MTSPVVSFLRGAETGDLKLCEEAYSAGAWKYMEPGFKAAMRKAAANGHLHICGLIRQYIRTAYESKACADGKHPPSDDYQSNIERRIAISIIPMLEGAAEGGHLDICLKAIEWRANKMAMMLSAAKAGNLQLCEKALKIGAGDANCMLIGGASV